MIQHIWTIPCRFALVDRQSNNVSLLEILEEITVPTKLPPKPEMGLVPALFDVVTLWSREDEDTPTTGKGRMTFLSPTGEELIVYEYDIDLSQVHRSRSAARLMGLPIATPGKYSFRIQRKAGGEEEWKEVARTPLWVKILRTEPDGETSRTSG